MVLIWIASTGRGNSKENQENMRLLKNSEKCCVNNIKISISLKNRRFIIQERFNKLIFGINTIIKCGTWQPVKFQLVSWKEMIFVSYLCINVANINSEIR